MNPVWGGPGAWAATARGAVVALSALMLAACGAEAQSPLPNAPAVRAVPTDATAAPPRITVAPQPLIVGDGAPAIFSVQVAGRGPFAFQWQREGVDIVGARGPALVITAAQRADDGARYGVVVTGADGTLNSALVHLRVEPAGFHVPFERIPGAI